MILSNFWTYARHGHAKSELVQVQNFTRTLGIACEPVYLRERVWPRISLGLLSHRLQLDHYRYLKQSVDKWLVLDLENEILNHAKRNCSKEKQVVFTSARVSHILLLRKLIARESSFGISIRLLDEPGNEEITRRLVDIIEDSNHRMLLAMETKSSIEKFSGVIPGLLHVPAAQAIRVDGTQTIQRDRLGVFWPVGRHFDEGQVYRILHQIEKYEPIVKLPNQVDREKIRATFPRVELISAGVEDRELAEILASVRIAILGHLNYVNQSSSYASYFVANNVPVVTSKSNSFFHELNKHGTMIDLDLEGNLLVQEISEILNTNWSETLTKYGDYVENQWRRFLTFN